MNAFTDGTVRDLRIHGRLHGRSCRSGRVAYEFHNKRELL
jgi:hypothetical protein